MCNSRDAPMPVLRPYPFDENLLPLVQDFDCGEDPWERDVSNWLKRTDLDDCAVRRIRDGRCRVWLYAIGRDRIVGFGSLGRARWILSDPGGGARSALVHIIPFIGVHTEFQGRPRRSRSGSYAYRILRHLLLQAANVADVESLIGLYVHERNARAIRFYRNWGFEDVPYTPSSDSFPMQYLQMVRTLPGDGIDATLEAFRELRRHTKRLDSTTTRAMIEEGRP